MKRGPAFCLALFLVCGFIGAAAGQIAARLAPHGSAPARLLAASVSPSLGPAEFDLTLFRVHLGIALHLNLTALLGMIAATVYCLRHN